MIEELKKNVSAVILTVADQDDAPTTWLEQAVKEVGELKKEKQAAKQELSKIRDGMERVEYK